MQNKSFTKKNSSILKYRNKLAKAYTRGGIESTPKECIARTYEALDAAVRAAQALVTTDGDGNSNKSEIDDIEVTVSALLMTKAEIPRKWSPQDCNEMKFMIVDW
jgi:hypothetical protein